VLGQQSAFFLGFALLLQHKQQLHSHSLSLLWCWSDCLAAACRSNFADAASCNPLLTRNTEILFRNVPVYLMFSQLRLPLDSAMLTPLLPVLNSASRSASARTAATTQQVLRQVSSSRSSAQKRGAHAAAVSVAAAAEGAADYGYYEEDTTLCGLTLVAKGLVTLRTRSGPETHRYKGHMETTLLWSNAVLSLPGFMADQLTAGPNGARTTANLFSTNVRQQLTSSVYNGIARAGINTVVGNSADITSTNGGTGSVTGGDATINASNNTARASAQRARLNRGNDVTDNTINVVNDLGSILEQYGDVLKAVCKNHKELGVAKPGQWRLDVSFAGAEEDPAGGSDTPLTQQQVLELLASFAPLPGGLANLSQDAVLLALFGTTDVNGLTEQDVLDALFP
jgi:hypothetical protein